MTTPAQNNPLRTTTGTTSEALASEIKSQETITRRLYLAAITSFGAGAALAFKGIAPRFTFLGGAAAGACFIFYARISQGKLNALIQQQKEINERKTESPRQGHQSPENPRSQPPQPGPNGENAQSQRKVEDGQDPENPTHLSNQISEEQLNTILEAIKEKDFVSAYREVRVTFKEEMPSVIVDTLKTKWLDFLTSDEILTSSHTFEEVMHFNETLHFGLSEAEMQEKQKELATRIFEHWVVKNITIGDPNGEQLFQCIPDIPEVKEYVKQGLIARARSVQRGFYPASLQPGQFDELERLLTQTNFSEEERKTILEQEKAGWLTSLKESRQTLETLVSILSDGRACGIIDLEACKALAFEILPQKYPTFLSALREYERFLNSWFQKNDLCTDPLFLEPFKGKWLEHLKTTWLEYLISNDILASPCDFKEVMQYNETLNFGFSPDEMQEKQKELASCIFTHWMNTNISIHDQGQLGRSYGVKLFQWIPAEEKIRAYVIEQLISYFYSEHSKQPNDPRKLSFLEETLNLTNLSAEEKSAIITAERRKICIKAFQDYDELRLLFSALKERFGSTKGILEVYSEFHDADAVDQFKQKLIEGCIYDVYVHERSPLDEDMQALGISNEFIQENSDLQYRRLTVPALLGAKWNEGFCEVVSKRGWAPEFTPKFLQHITQQRIDVLAFYRSHPEIFEVGIFTRETLLPSGKKMGDSIDEGFKSYNQTYLSREENWTAKWLNPLIVTRDTPHVQLIALEERMLDYHSLYAAHSWGEVVNHKALNSEGWSRFILKNDPAVERFLPEPFKTQLAEQIAVLTELRDAKDQNNNNEQIAVLTNERRAYQSIKNIWELWGQIRAYYAENVKSYIFRRIR